MKKNDGSIVSEEQWQKFLDNEISPRFPKGFTILTAGGQYQGANGIIKENSRVMIVFYPVNKRKTFDRKIEQIRKQYKNSFAQESVMRVDFPTALRVTF